MKSSTPRIENQDRKITIISMLSAPKTPRKKMPELVTAPAELVKSIDEIVVKEPVVEESKKKNRCISRITYENVAQHFGNRRNKFYIEFRCIYPCYKNMDVCIKCLEKSPDQKKQVSHKFDHGKVNEPITDESHIYGGKWYNDGVKKWGEPPSEIIEYAIQHQQEARGDFKIETTNSASKVDDQTTFAENTMPKAKKSVSTSNPISISVSILAEDHVADNKDIQPKKVRKSRKPTLVDEEEREEEKVTKKKTRKPKPSLDIIVTEESKPSKKRVSPKKKDASPYESIVTIDPIIYKEVTLPTHMEKTMELFDMDQYEIEYVKVQPCTISGVTYFKDNKKNKVYKRIKEKIVGEYIGRYDPYTDSLVTDIPDSDDESE